MSSIRLYKSQIDRLRKSRASGLDIIKFAIKRFERNEFVTQKPVLSKNEDLCIYSIRQKAWKYDDSKIREILNYHFTYPKDHMNNINSLDEQITSMFNQYQNMPFIIEEV